MSWRIIRKGRVLRWWHREWLSWGGRRGKAACSVPLRTSLYAILSETPGNVSVAFRSLQEFTQDISKAKLPVETGPPKIGILSQLGLALTSCSCLPVFPYALPRAVCLWSLVLRGRHGKKTVLPPAKPYKALAKQVLLHNTRGLVLCSPFRSRWYVSLREGSYASSLKTGVSLAAAKQYHG